VVLEGPPRFVGRLRRRQARRLLRRISARGATRPLLGSLGPSISYVELEGDSPSIVVIPLDGGIRITAARDALWCSFASGGAKESLPLVPERAPAALSIAPGAIVEGSRVSALLGFEPRYLVVALLSPDAGHARKSVIGILPRP
jgi:hypothetical protein